MKINRICLIIAIPVLLLHFPSPAKAFGPSTNSKEARFQSGDSAGAVEAFSPPMVTVDDKEIPTELILSALKFRWAQSRLFHSPKPFANFARDNLDKVIKTLTVRALLEREGRRSGIKPDEKKFNSYFEKKLKNMGGRQAMEKFFEPSGLSMNDYRKLAQNAYAAKLYTEKLYSGIKITGTDTRKFYDDNPGQFGTLERRVISFVRFRFLDDPPDREALDDLKAAPEKIKTFTQMSLFADSHRARYKTRSDILRDISITSAKGGLFWPTASKLKEGTCGYFETGARKEHYLVFVEKVYPGKIKPYREVRNNIEKRLLKQKQTALLKEKVAELEAKSRIVVLQRAQ